MNPKFLSISNDVNDPNKLQLHIITEKGEYKNAVLTPQQTSELHDWLSRTVTLTRRQAA